MPHPPRRPHDPPAPPRPGGAGDPGARPLDTLFGGFWPEPGRARQRARGPAQPRASACWPAWCCRSATSGSAPSWCCWPPAASSSPAACTAAPRSRWPAPRCASCSAAPSPSATPTGSWSCACWPAPRSASPGWCTAARLPGVRAGRARLAARRAPRPAVAGSLRARGHRARAAAPRRCARSSGRCSGWSSSGCSSPPPTPSSPSGRARCCPTCSWTRSCCAAFLTVAVGGVVLAAAYLALNPPRVEPRPVPGAPVAHRYEWLAPVLLVDAVFAAFLVAQATVVFGGHDYLRAHDRAHLRGVRPPGLRPAHRRHRAHPAGRVGRRPQGAPRDGRGPRLAARLARAALRADAGRGRLGALPHARLPGGLRLHPAPPAGRRLRGLARAAGARRARGGPALRAAVAAPLRPAQRRRAAARRSRRSTRTPGSREHNLDRYDDTGKVDWTYLRGLSDDAVPVLADAARTTPCGAPSGAATSPPTTGWSGTSGGTAPRTC